MQVLSLLVRKESGAIQRVLGLLTRRCVPVDTLLVGRCEHPECQRLVLASNDPRLPRLVEPLRRLHDVIDAQCVQEKANWIHLVRSTTPDPSSEAPVSSPNPEPAYVQLYGAL